MLLFFFLDVKSYLFIKNKITQKRKQLFNVGDRFLINPYKFSTTLGSLVNRSFINVLNDFIDKKDCSYEFTLSVYKLGILNTHNSNYKKNVEIFNSRFSDIPKLIEEFKEKYEKDKRRDTRC